MTVLNKPSSAEFNDVLTDANVRQVQIIQAALGFGIVMFATVVVVLFYMNPAATDETDSGFMWTLTLMQFAIGFPMFGMSFALYRRKLSRAVLGTDKRIRSPEDIFHALRQALIFRLAFMEGAALYGLVVCMVGAINGTIHVYPVFWINLVGALGMLLFLSWSFPTKERLLEFYKNDVLT